MNVCPQPEVSATLSSYASNSTQGFCDLIILCPEKAQGFFDLIIQYPQPHLGFYDIMIIPLAQLLDSDEVWMIAQGQNWPWKPNGGAFVLSWIASHLSSLTSNPEPDPDLGPDWQYL